MWDGTLIKGRLVGAAFVRSGEGFSSRAQLGRRTTKLMLGLTPSSVVRGKAADGDARRRGEGILWTQYAFLKQSRCTGVPQGAVDQGGESKLPPRVLLTFFRVNRRFSFANRFNQ